MLCYRTLLYNFVFCFISAGSTIMKCENVDYFPKEEYSPDPNDSTMAIPCKFFMSFVRVFIRDDVTF